MGSVKRQEKKLIIWIMWILANHSFFLGGGWGGEALSLYLPSANPTDFIIVRIKL